MQGQIYGGMRAIIPPPRKVGRKFKLISTILNYCMCAKIASKRHQIVSFSTQKSKNFLGRGIAPSPDLSPKGKRETPSLHLTLI